MENHTTLKISIDQILYNDNGTKNIPRKRRQKRKRKRKKNNSQKKEPINKIIDVPNNNIDSSNNDVLKKSFVKQTLEDVCIRMHKLVIHVQQFLRLWILHKIENKEYLPHITKDTISLAFKVLVTKSNGPKPKNDNLKIYEEFEKFYKDYYSKLGYSDKINGKNLSRIINYIEVTILTNIENNIIFNFCKYIKSYINASFKKEHDAIIEKITGKKKKQLLKTNYVMN